MVAAPFHEEKQLLMTEVVGGILVQRITKTIILTVHFILGIHPVTLQNESDNGNHEDGLKGKDKKNELHFIVELKLVPVI
jgi:hypothetical protein